VCLCVDGYYSVGCILDCYGSCGVCCECVVLPWYVEPCGCLSFVYSVVFSLCVAVFS